MTVNLQTNRSELLAAYDKVLNPNDDINWALFSYEGKTNVLKVTDTGDGGLDELSTSFNSGKVQYALASVDHVVTKQPKILLIQWQGDGVSASTLGTTATHVHEISKFFKGIHVTYHARCDDDVEPEMLMAAVNKVTAALSNVGDRSSHTSETTAPGVVSSVYKRTLPNRELNLSERDKFWQKVQEDEVSRQSDELRRLNTINEQHERDRKSHTEQLHVEQEKSMIGRQQQQQQHSPPAVFVKQQQRAPVSLPVTNRYQPPSPPSSPPPASNGNAIHHQAPSKPVPIDDEEDGFDDHSNRIVDDEPPIVAEPEHHSIVDDNDEEHVPVADVDDDDVPLPRAIDGLGIQAVAMWDYQAADDTELSFDPHDMITHIEQIDAGWWHGHTSDGRQGLFPANYVQLLK